MRTMAIALGVLAVATASGASAADFGLINQLYVQSTAAIDQHTDYDYQSVQSATPLVLSFTNSAASYGASAGATATASAYYGKLDASGSGYAAPSAGNGAASRVISYYGGAPLVEYYDKLYVNSDTLAAGSAVSITFTIDYSGDAGFQNEPCCDQSSASISSAFKLGSENSDYQTATFDIEHGMGVFHDVTTITAHVGDTLDLDGKLFASGEAASFDAGGGSSFWFSDPSTLTFASDTPDAYITTASGADYSAPVPEPASWGLLAIGLFGIGGAMRKRSAASPRIA